MNIFEKETTWIFIVNVFVIWYVIHKSDEKTCAIKILKKSFLWCFAFNFIETEIKHLYILGRTSKL